jgi:hypothetical protein
MGKITTVIPKTNAILAMLDYDFTFPMAIPGFPAKALQTHQ